jgi:hypothetical protein
MKHWREFAVLAVACTQLCLEITAQQPPSASAAKHEDQAQQAYIGFDRNHYPGNDALPRLRRYFAFSSYWLNIPPGATKNSWVGKRAQIEEAGFGFLVLFNGRLNDELKKTGNAAELGRSDAEAAIAAAGKEGFPRGTIIFLDIEEGGRLLTAQRAYVLAWVDRISNSDFKAGVYCSGIATEAGDSGSITANDLRDHAEGRSIALWVANDACPPSPGCTIPEKGLFPTQSGVADPSVWQYAQSPHRKDIAQGCPRNYATDGNCYGAEAVRESSIFVDLDVAAEADPSHGRTGQR